MAKRYSHVEERLTQAGNTPLFLLLFEMKIPENEREEKNLEEHVQYVEVMYTVLVNTVVLYSYSRVLVLVTVEFYIY